MTTEEKLKNLILQKYRSIREFTQYIDMPYSTFDTILKRGINTASVANVIKICKALDISADELADGRIIHVKKDEPDYTATYELKILLNDVKDKLRDSDTLTLDGKELDPLDRLAVSNALDVAVEIGKRPKEKDRERLLNLYSKLSKKQ